MQQAKCCGKKSFLRNFSGTAVAAGLALLFLGVLSVQAQPSGQMRPFKVELIGGSIALGDGYGTFEYVGNATHLGKCVAAGDWYIAEVLEADLFLVHFSGTYTAANGDTIDIECMDYVVDWRVFPAIATGTVHFVRGTGRFANVSGSYTVVATLYSDEEVLEGEGVISY